MIITQKSIYLKDIFCAALTTTFYESPNAQNTEGVKQKSVDATQSCTDTLQTLIVLSSITYTI
jgi:hypothetical protein